MELGHECYSQRISRARGAHAAHPRLGREASVMKVTRNLPKSYRYRRQQQAYLQTKIILTKLRRLRRSTGPRRAAMR